MAYLKKRVSVCFMLLLLIAVTAAVPGGCSHKTAPQATQDVETVPDTTRITGITATREADGTLVRISGTRALTYTSVKQTSPLAVVLYFPETALGEVQTVQNPENGLIKEVRASELATDAKAVRVEISLNQDATYTVDRTDSGLTLLFPESAPGEVSGETTLPSETPVARDMATTEKKLASTAAPADSLSSVTTEDAGDHALILVQADGTIQNYTTFTLADPPRIVYDIPSLQSPFKTEQIVDVDNRWVKRVRFYTYPDKVRLVVDTSKEYLLSYTADATDTGLVIQVGENTQAAASTSFPKTDAITPVAYSQKPSAAQKSATGSEAWVNRIDFSSDAGGKSTVTIGTTGQAEYTLEKSGENSLLLTVLNAKLPEYRERPLITSHFESAIDRILPHRKADAPENAFFTFELRETVPYHVEQQENSLLVHFDASSVPPKASTEPAVPSLSADPVQAAVAPNPSVTETAQNTTPVKASTPVEMTESNTDDVPRYTGEKIALDFYETDIKNVFRILREVSGMNFAIDKDVTGKVTLSFDEPVPWDQVLDLILKMNQLGKVMEGNIVRIATVDTLAKEESERQAALVAAQKSKEQEVALEPLATEYLAVSYSNAKSEILPHIQAILSQGRGKAEVDERSNLIVITDTEKVIRQAKVIVQRLDKVTPQVMIEARVVEVNTGVTTELGIDWGVGQEGVASNELGGSYNWDVAMNYPFAATTNGAGFQFTRIAGTALTIDAQLNALETQSKGKILSSPKIVTLDNKKATIKQGLEVAYYERDDSGGSSVKFKNVDLLLEVTPHVTPDNRVSMIVLITKNDMAGETSEGAPILSTNEAETESLVNDGETIVIGGIIKKTETYGESGFPILKDIPGLKWLFSKKSSKETKQELLIFITPKIVTLSQRAAE